MGHYLVVGLGSIGGPIAKKLADSGHKVSGMMRGYMNGRVGIVRIQERLNIHHVYREDVTELINVEHMVHLGSEPFDGVVYAAGNCPPNGFDKEVEKPMSKLGWLKVKEDLDTHAIGLYYLMRFLISRDLLSKDARIAVIGSAITRFVGKEQDAPPPLHFFHYAAAKAAQEAIANGFNHEFRVDGSSREVVVLKPGAVDTPFHEGSKFNPPNIVSVESVVEDALAALNLQ